MVQINGSGGGLALPRCVQLEQLYKLAELGS